MPYFLAHACEIGIKLAWLINEPDNVFRPLVTEYDGETMALAEFVI